jgi:hypothetical protein
MRSQSQSVNNEGALTGDHNVIGHSHCKVGSQGCRQENHLGLMVLKCTSTTKVTEFTSCCDKHGSTISESPSKSSLRVKVYLSHALNLSESISFLPTSSQRRRLLQKELSKRQLGRNVY